MVWCGTRGGLSILVYVRAVVCKVPHSVVRHARAPHKSDLGRKDRLLRACGVVRFVHTALQRVGE